MSDILELVESNPESRITEEVKAMLAAYDQAVTECERLRAEVEALKGLCDLQAMAIRQLERHRQLPKDIKDAIAVLRGEGE